MCADIQVEPLNRFPPLGVTALVVDNDPIQIASIRRGMFLLGNECIVKNNVTEALEFLGTQDGKSVELLLTDISDPRNRTLRVIAGARQLLPDLPVIAICGFDWTLEMEQLHRAGVVLLRRPFNPDGLQNAIHMANAQ